MRPHEPGVAGRKKEESHRVAGGALLGLPALEPDRRDQRRRRLEPALDPHRLRVRADALPRRAGAVLPVPARSDGAAGGDKRLGAFHTGEVLFPLRISSC